MKKVISGIAVAVLAIAGGAVSGGAAYAAPAATTLVMSGGNGVFELGPIVINGNASAAGAVVTFGFVVEQPVGHFGLAAVTFLTVVPLQQVIVLFAAFAVAPLANKNATAVKRTSAFAFLELIIFIVNSHLSLSCAVLTRERLSRTKIYKRDFARATPMQGIKQVTN